MTNRVGAVLLAPARAAALLLLTIGGVVLAVASLQLLLLVVTAPLVAFVARRYATAGRWAAGRWGGVPVEVPYRPHPDRPQPRADGLYQYGDQLYRSSWMPAFLARADAYGQDSANRRDLFWLLVTPVGGGLAVAVPVALLAAGAWALSIGGGWVAAGLAAVAAAFVVAPASLRLYGRWNRFLLGPLRRHETGFGAWLRRSSLATWRAAGLAGLALGTVGILVLHVVSLVVSWGALYPWVASATRPYLDLYRRVAGRWQGTEYPVPYAQPDLPAPDEDGKYRVNLVLYGTAEAAQRALRYRTTLRDPATWRDLLWLATGVPAGVLGLVPALLVAVGQYVLLLQPFSWCFWAPLTAALSGGVWVPPWWLWTGLQLIWPAARPVPGWTTLVAGALLAALGLALAGPLLRLRAAIDGRLLGPTRTHLLTDRVALLTQTRADAVDAQATELRRIERNLHDGAQARIVAVGLALSTVELLLETNPAKAKALLAQARSTSESALSDLRDLVRGIHPPVLAERGLADAVRAVALDVAIPVRVRAALDGRADAPVETAAYFATVEALTNAARHAQATSIDIDIAHEDGVLRIRVTDDGRGGADPAAGTGLAGIRRRLGTLDGVLHIASPAGGPTTLIMEIPCALSSPRISPSSGTA